jgi:CxxC motif-containing protein (DUF1111 family)
MRSVKLTILACFLVLSPLATANSAHPAGSAAQSAAIASEAPTGFDNLTNGFEDQASFDADLETFAEVETDADGVGPVYNARSCAECHATPVVGGSSQVTELRAGHMAGFTFVEHPGGSLIHSRSIDASIQEQVMDGNEVRAHRASPSILGAGFVESINDSTLVAISLLQVLQSGGRIFGQTIAVPVDEAPGSTRIGRFGWKNQQASLLSFSGDAYLNEMGITTPLAPLENSSNGSAIDLFDLVPLGNPADPDDEDLGDLEAFTRFMRATKAPPRDAARAASPEARAGESLFNAIGCAICHVPSITTAPAGTSLNGGTFVVPPALGSKIIHPYGDFLLHNVGTGDGIVQNGGPSTRLKVRTAPLWGLRTRNRFMHDAASLTVVEAILRHGGEASFVTSNYRRLSFTQRNQITAFLKSL